MEINFKNLAELIAAITEKAGLETYYEDGENSPDGFDPQDMSGGNFDDAYAMGEVDGQINFARELLKLINQ